MSWCLNFLSGSDFALQFASASDKKYFPTWTSVQPTPRDARNPRQINNVPHLSAFVKNEGNVLRKWVLLQWRKKFSFEWMKNHVFFFFQKETFSLKFPWSPFLFHWFHRSVSAPRLMSSLSPICPVLSSRSTTKKSPNNLSWFDSLSFYSLCTKRAFVRILAEATFNVWSLGARWIPHFAVFNFSNKEPILGNNKYTLNKEVILLFCLKV